MKILLKLTEITTYGCIEDESERDEYKTSYHVFNESDDVDEFLTGYYESQDYSYRIQSKILFKVYDNEFEEIKKVLNNVR
jgi:hypothetical protein